MHLEPHFASTSAAFVAGVEWFVSTVRAVSESGVALETTALGVWDLRDLTGHTSRAISTVVGYLRPGESASRLTTADYYRLVRSGRADPDEVAERGRQAGRDLGEDLAEAVTRIAAEALPIVAARGPDARVVAPVGEWTLGEYLPTRVFELAVHTADLRRAVHLASEAPPPVNRVALSVLAMLVEQAPDAAAEPLLRALTGRGRLPEGLSLL